eukprot:IDg21313t1
MAACIVIVLCSASIPKHWRSPSIMPIVHGDLHSRTEDAGVQYGIPDVSCSYEQWRPYRWKACDKVYENCPHGERQGYSTGIVPLNTCIAGTINDLHVALRNCWLREQLHSKSDVNARVIEPMNQSMGDTIKQ